MKNWYYFPSYAIVAIWCLFHELKPNCIGPSNHWHNHYTIFKLKTNNQKRNTESPRKTTKISFYQNDKTFSITVMVCWFENLTLIYYCQMNHNYTLLGYPLTTMSMPHQYKWKQKNIYHYPMDMKHIWTLNILLAPKLLSLNQKLPFYVVFFFFFNSDVWNNQNSFFGLSLMPPKIPPKYFW